MTSKRENTSRRDFLKTSTGAAVGSALFAQPLMAAHAAGSSEKLRVGLVGCGGRGAGAVANALRASAENELVAMGDLFEDHLAKALRRLERSDVKERIRVDEEHRFVGFDAYEHVIDACDVVLLCATPHFRPRHLAHAIEKGRHVFCEKPVAVDAPGVRSVVASVAKAKAKRLAIVSGLCYRYHRPKREVMERVHQGAIGDILTLQATYHTGGLWHRGRDAEWTEMEYQLRNWLYYAWLSGDIITEQHIHSLDKVAWAMRDEYPAAVTASGGRSQRTEEKYGNVFDHFTTVYDFESGAKAFCSCRQWNGCTNDVSDYAYGTKGTAALQTHRIKGENAWRFEGRGGNMYDDEHQALFASIREGRPINNGEYMWKSTLMAIMGRMSAYTGKRITWEQALASQRRLGPAKYEWGSVETDQVAIPGVTKFA